MDRPITLRGIVRFLFVCVVAVYLLFLLGGYFRQDAKLKELEAYCAGLTEGVKQAIIHLNMKLERHTRGLDGNST